MKSPLIVEPTFQKALIIGCRGHIFEVLIEDQSKAERVFNRTLEWF